jgi:methyltransferase
VNASLFALLLLGLVAERLLELRSAKRNTARLIAEGGREFGASHYPAIVAMHTAFFISLIVEFILRQAPLSAVWLLPFSLFALAQCWRLWSRRTMAGRWTARVIVIPGERLIARGPYRLVRHPIYIAVALELFSFPLIFGLYDTCLIFTALNACMLLLVRIPCEDRALAWSQSV